MVSRPPTTKIRSLYLTRGKRGRIKIKSKTRSQREVVLCSHPASNSECCSRAFGCSEACATSAITARLDADFAPGFHLLLGDNAQGKTNILEAIYLLATLRSFRGVGGAQMVRHGQKGYFVGARRAGADGARDQDLLVAGGAEIDAWTASRCGNWAITWGRCGRWCFARKTCNWSRGRRALRRRFMDLLLTQTHPVYLPLLQRYAAALRSRNALLKQPAPEPDALEGFTRQLVEAGAELMRFRHDLVPRVAPLAREACARVAGTGERLDLEYQPSVRARLRGGTGPQPRARKGLSLHRPRTAPGRVATAPGRQIRPASSPAKGRSAPLPSP